MNNSAPSAKSALDTASQLHRSALRLIRLMQGGRTAGKLSLAQVGVLSRLYRGGTATANALARYLRIQPQSLTRLLADLERRGLITRRPNEADRRQSFLDITEAGTRLLTEDVRDQWGKIAEIIDRELTTAESEILRLAAGLMDKLAAAVEKEEAAEP